MTNAKIRLISNSVRNHETNCLIWNRYSQNGYGKTSFRNKSIYTHRLSYIMFNNNGEPIPSRDEDGARIIVRHMCNNSLCIEPSHLELGTQYQNDYDDKILHGTLVYTWSIIVLVLVVTLVGISTSCFKLNVDD